MKVSMELTIKDVLGRTMLLIWLVVCCMSCQYVAEKRSKDVVAECCGKTLTISEIERMTEGYTGEDSARIADVYIRNWAIELLMYDASHRVASHQIEELVEDYRRSLYIHEYEQLLVSQRMSQLIEDTLVDAFYSQHKQQLVLSEMILKGALLVLPNQAPDLPKLRKYLGDLDDAKSMEWIEKYVYQYGVGYELFVEDWKKSEEVLACMPLEQEEFSKLLQKSKLVEVKDSVNTYLLEVLDYRSVGSVMPLDYARKDIEKNILGARRHAFIRSAREDLYNKSIKNGKLKRYEK